MLSGSSMYFRGDKAVYADDAQNVIWSRKAYRTGLREILKDPGRI